MSIYLTLRLVVVNLVVNKEEAMTLDEAIKEFGSKQALANRLGVSRQTVYLWEKKGQIPFARRAQIELETNGKLKAK